MKKLIYILMLLILISFVSAIYSTDRTNYYYNGSVYLTDGIEDTDIALDGTAANNGDSPSTYGWRTNNGAIIYTNSLAYIGSLSITVPTVANVLSIEIVNNSFTGFIGFSWAVGGLGGDEPFYLKGNGGTELRGLKTKQTTGAIEFYNGAGWAACAGNPTVSANQWVNVSFNVSNEALYINEVYCGAISMSNIDYLLEWQSQGQGQFIDGFWVSNNNRPESTAVTWNNPTPPTGTINNTQITINVSSLTGDNITIWFDNNPNPVTNVYNNKSSPGVYTTAVTISQTYYYKASSNSGLISNSSVRTWIYDVGIPGTDFRADNFFNEDNSSNLSRSQTNKNISIKFTDNRDLFAYEINITNTTGQTYFYNSSESLSGTEFNVSQYVNFTNWELGNYTARIKVWDSHNAPNELTKQKVEDYIVKEKSKELEFYTYEKNTVKITSDCNSITKAIKKDDGYGFEFDFVGCGNDKWFTVSCDNKLTYRTNTGYNGHFVCWNPETKDGNSIDFEGLDMKPSVIKFGDDYRVKFTTPDSKVTFKSIQGLNSNETHKSFTLTSLYPINPYLKISNNPSNEWSFTGEYSGSTNVSMNISYLNDILKNGCLCSGCNLTETTCNIPLIFHSDAIGILNVNSINITYAYGIDNCSNSYGISSNATALNISYYDAISSLSPVNYALSFFYGLTSVTESNYSFGNYGTNLSICIYPNWANLRSDFLVTYNNFSYNALDYILNNKTNLLDLYFSAGTTLVTFKVTDFNDNPIQNALIYILKYDVGTNSYFTSEVLKTDINGEAIGNIILFTDFYKFNIVVDGGLKLVDPETQGVKIWSTSRTFRISLDETEWFDNYETLFGAVTSLTFNNDTNSFVYSWNDPTSAMHQACLKVVQRNYTHGDTLISDTCTTSTAGSIVQSIGTPSNKSSYIGTGYFKFDLEYITDIYTKVFSDNYNPIKMDATGIFRFSGWLLILAVAAIGLPFPGLSFILFAITLILTIMAQLFEFSIGIAVSMLIIGLVFLNKKK